MQANFSHFCRIAIFLIASTFPNLYGTNADGMTESKSGQGKKRPKQKRNRVRKKWHKPETRFYNLWVLYHSILYFHYFHLLNMKTMAENREIASSSSSTYHFHSNASWLTWAYQHKPLKLYHIWNWKVLRRISKWKLMCSWNLFLICLLRFYMCFV